MMCTCRTKSIGSCKSFEVTAELTKPSQSVVVYISSVRTETDVYSFRSHIFAGNLRWYHGDPIVQASFATDGIPHPSDPAGDRDRTSSSLGAMPSH